LPHRGFVTGLHMNGLDGATDRRRDFDNGLVGFQFEHRLLCGDGIPYGYKDLQHVT
jgi:hypothetical protein